MTHRQPGLVLLTGASGYVGGRLLQRLEQEDWRLRCLTRRPERVGSRAAATTEVVRADLLDASSLQVAMQRVDTAIYLAHAMGEAGDFAERERLAAVNFGTAARRAGVARIVYLGGLGDGPELSPHLRSRHEVGRILCASGVPTIELRASVVIGSGSAAFEVVRDLVERLPLLPVPRWAANTIAQPIAADDLLDYLLAAIARHPARSALYEIGGADRVRYIDLLRVYADQRGLRRRFIFVPGLSPALCRAGVRMLTPLYGPVAAAMLDSARNETVVHDPATNFLGVHPQGLAGSIARTLTQEDQQITENRWVKTLPQRRRLRWGGQAVGRRRVVSRTERVPWPPGQAFAPIQRIGGRTGWYGTDVFWSLRGLLDTLRGGVGLRRGRRDRADVRIGDTIDFWRVERAEPDRLLVLSAEMRIPGRLWLRFDVEEERGLTAIRLTTVFEPAGLVGRGYWYLLFPVHMWVFGRMLRGIAVASQSPQVPTVQAGAPVDAKLTQAGSTPAAAWARKFYRSAVWVAVRQAR